MNTNIELTSKATAIVKADVSAFKTDRLRYAQYVAEMQVTRDTVAAHVAIFRDAFKAARGNKNVDGDTVKAYATKVRNGLNYQLGKVEADNEDQPVNYLTAQGLAELADMDADAQHAAIMAEVERRSN